MVCPFCGHLELWSPAILCARFYRGLSILWILIMESSHSGCKRFIESCPFCGHGEILSPAILYAMRFIEVWPFCWH